MAGPLIDSIAHPKPKALCGLRVKIIAIFLLLGHFSNAPAAELEDLKENDAHLVLRAPNLINAERIFKRSVDVRSITEIGLWQAASESASTASLLLVRPRYGASNIVFTEESVLPIAQQIMAEGQGSADATINLGDTGKATNHIGELQFQRFAVNADMRCVYMRQFFGSAEEFEQIVNSNLPALGTHLLQGWYCAKPRAHALSDDELERFFQGVGVKDWSMPKP